MFTDKDTCSFIQEQKSAQFHDLKHVLQVMGRLEHGGVAMARPGDRELSSKPSYSPTSPLTSSEHVTFPPSPLLSASHSPISPTPSTDIMATTVSPTSTDIIANTLSSPTARTHQEPQSSPDTLPETLSTHILQEQHKTLTQNHCTPRDFVAIFLLENNRLLSSAVNQMKQEDQVQRLLAFACDVISNNCGGIHGKGGCSTCSY